MTKKKGVGKILKVLKEKSIRSSVKNFDNLHLSKACLSELDSFVSSLIVNIIEVTYLNKSEVSETNNIRLSDTDLYNFGIIDEMKSQYFKGG